MPTQHKHAELIKAWADGAEIEGRPYPGAPWEPCHEPTWNIGICEYRIKPAAPKWPQTTMTDVETLDVEVKTMGASAARRAIANAAIAHACEAGQLVPADKVREISAGAYAQGAKSVRDPVDIIEAVFDHLRAGIADPESIQAILLRAAK